MSKENTIGSLPADPERGDTSPADQDPSDEDAFVLDWRKCLINAFLLWQMSAVAVWLLPPSLLQFQLSAIAKPYMMMTGCWQAWTMFSPQPSNTDMYVDAVIEYKDGSQRTWDFPRMSRLDLWTRYREERWRKAIENMQGDQSRGYWPYLARYAALQENPQPQLNPPVKVRLFRHFRIVPPPGVPLPPFTDYEFYHQAITPDVLAGKRLILPPPIKFAPAKKAAPKHP
jgi:hypothetical protein